METRLNGGSPFSLRNLKQTEDFRKDNPVPNRIEPQKQPGLYMIRCVANDWRYYGETKNVSGRLASHRSMLNRKIHPNQLLQNEFNYFGVNNFDFVVLYQGPMWEDRAKRLDKELELLIDDREICYNIYDVLARPGEKNPFFGRVHTPEAKRKVSESMKGIPNDLLGRKVFVKGVIYPSIAEASRQTNVARKTIRTKINNPNETNYYEINEPG